MQWFRANIRHGAALALVALLIQAVLSFGHSHARAEASPGQIAGQSDRAALTFAHDLTSDRAHGAATSPDQDRHHDDGCAICAVAAMTANAIAPCPPWLLLPPPPALSVCNVVRRVAWTQTAQAFQARAPPSLG